MRTKTLIILALITVAVLAYIQFFDNKTAGTFERERASLRVMNLSAGDVNHLEITSPKGSFIFNKDAKNGWQLQSPIKYPASNQAVDGLLSQLSFEERRATLDKSRLEDLPQKLNQFGLKSPETTLKLKTKSGVAYRLDLGKETAVAGAIYGRIEQDGQENFIILPQGIKQLIQKSLDQWRSNTVFNFTTDQVKEVVLHLESKDVEIKKEGEDWKISKPLTAGADENEMRSYLANLLGIRATQFVTDNPAEYTNYSLNSPSLVLDINLGKEVVSLRIGKVEANNETKYYAQQTSQPAVFVVQKATVDFIANLLDQVRDRRIIRIKGPDNVTNIEYQKGAFSIGFESLPGIEKGWEITGSDHLPADTAEVQTLLTKISNARVTSYQLATDENRAALGLKAPLAQIQFKIQDGNDKKAAPKTYTLKFSAAKKGEMAVESSFRDDIVMVPADVLVGLPDQETDWLSKSVRVFEPSQITGISWKRGSEVVSLAKDAKGSWPKVVNGKKVSDIVVEHQAAALSGIPVSGWREVTDKEFATPALVLTVSRDKEQKVLEIITDAKNGGYCLRFAGTKLGGILSVRDFDLLNMSPFVPEKTN